MQGKRIEIANIPYRPVGFLGTKKDVKMQEKPKTGYYAQFSSVASNAIKNNAIPAISFMGKSEDIPGIVAKLKKKYGIEAEFENLYTAKMILKCVEHYTGLNNRNMFNGLKIGVLDEQSDVLWSTSIDYENREYKLNLNNSMTKKEIKDLAQDKYDDCYIPSNNPECYFYEALADFLNFNSNTEMYKKCLNAKMEDCGNSLYRARKMGDCATKNAIKYFDAYMASKMCKVEVPPGVDEEFESLFENKIKLPPLRKQELPFNKTFDFKTIKEAKKYLEQYGVDAEFFDLKYANLMVGAIEDFIKINNNPDMFKGLKIRTKEIESTVFGHVLTEYDFAKDKELECVLELNPASDFDPEVEYNIAHLASPSEKHPFYHELAHWLHYQNNPKRYHELSIVCKHPDFELGSDEEEIRLIGKIGNYALKNPHEFFAEYIAAKMAGCKFPEGVDKAYAYGLKTLGFSLDLKFPE